MKTYGTCSACKKKLGEYDIIREPAETENGITHDLIYSACHDAPVDDLEWPELDFS